MSDAPKVSPSVAEVEAFFLHELAKVPELAGKTMAEVMALVSNLMSKL